MTEAFAVSSCGLGSGKINAPCMSRRVSRIVTLGGELRERPTGRGGQYRCFQLLAILC